jgi:hypothetical protein
MITSHVSLSSDEMAEVLRSPHPEKLLIGGHVDLLTDTLVLSTGGFTLVHVPLTWFEPESCGFNFLNLEIVDCGQTVKFGDFEVAVETILKEFRS